MDKIKTNVEEAQGVGTTQENKQVLENGRKSQAGEIRPQVLLKSYSNAVKKLREVGLVTEEDAKTALEIHRRMVTEYTIQMF